MKKRGILFLFIFIIISIGVYAIGISPSRSEISFEPNKEIDCSYSLINNIKQEPYYDLNVFVYAVGDLNESIKIEQGSVVLPPNKWVDFNCTMTLPSELSPGLHDNGIIATETNVAAGMVGSLAGVKMQLWIWVPYPGKYLDGILNVDDIEINKEANFNINLISRGEEDINNVKIYVDVYDSFNNKIATVESESFEIKSYESKEMNIKWNSHGNKAGMYSAIARIYYDNSGFLELRDDFRIGDLYIDILNVTIENIKKNTIGKFIIDVQSMWNSEIEDVYATVEIIYNDKKIDSVNSESLDIDAWNKETLAAYWDSRDAEIGDYKARVIVNYEGKTSEKTIDFKIIELNIFDKLKSNVAYIIIIIVLLLLILLNIIITLHYKRKNEKKKK